MTKQTDEWNWTLIAYQTRNKNAEENEELKRYGYAGKSISSDESNNSWSILLIHFIECCLVDGWTLKWLPVHLGLIRFPFCY